jgi:hypothetical protein
VTTTDTASDFHQAWAAELDRLEVDVELAEAMLASASAPTAAEEALDLQPWAPPPMRGPLPSDLEPRARLVLERQLAIAALLTERLTVTQRHRRLTQKIRDTGEPDIPVYLDITA